MKLLAETRPDLDDPLAAIVAGQVWVDGFPITNPDSLVDRSASITVRRPKKLAGEAKLEHALATFDVAIAGRVAVDVGAAAGGFTRVLLRHGARRVYAVDAGHGQLLGSLRQDPRCVNLEATNLAALGTALIPDPVGVVTIDVSYLSLAAAVPQLGALRFAPSAELLALVKPMYELGLAELPDPAQLASAVTAAAEGIEGAGWSVVDWMKSPVPGGRGAVEAFIHAARP